MEEVANELLGVYASQYYGNGTATSAYLWDQDDGGVAGCFLVRKRETIMATHIFCSVVCRLRVGCHAKVRVFAANVVLCAEIEGAKDVTRAVWNTINVVQATPAGAGSFSYRLTTSLVLDVEMKSDEVGEVSLAGTLNRKAAKSATPPSRTATGAGATQPDHVAVWGEMLETMESALRDTVDGVYFAKTNAAMCAARQVGGASTPAQSASFVASLNAAVVAHGTKRTALDS